MRTSEKELIKSAKEFLQAFVEAESEDTNIVAILDKIRAEIEQRPYGVANDSLIQGEKCERAAILEILNKYKAAVES